MPRVRLGAGRLASLAIVVALVATLAVTALTPAGAAPVGSGSGLVVSPRQEAIVTGSSVRVVVKRSGRSRTRIRLNRRNVTRRFQRRGKQLVGRLSARDGLRPGRNSLAVNENRGGVPEQRHTRSFFYARHSRFLRVRLTGTNPALLRIDVRGGGSRLELARRRRTIRVRLNGRSVTGSVVPTSGTGWTTSLSGTHGLRYGVNTLSISVAEPHSGRYATFTKRFRVRRTRPIAAAGADSKPQAGVAVRLGGRHRAARGGRLSYRWTLVRRPRGSRARIRGATRARPTLVPDRPGRYMARVHVDENVPGRASASRVTGTSHDQVQMGTRPANSLFALSANGGPSGNRGVVVGENGAFHKNTGPAGTIHWLELDRQSLGELNNTYCCADDGAIGRLSGRMNAASADRLVIVTIPAQRNTLATSQYRDFYGLLNTIGVSRDTIADEDLNKPGQQIVIVGVPTGGAGSAYVTRRHASNGTSGFPNLGWLMLDGELADGFRFQPLRLTFNTSSSSTPTSNTMTFQGQPPVVSPAVEVGSTGAFHLVELDPADLSVVHNRSFPNNETGRSQMADAIGAASEVDEVGNYTGRGNYLALQSIGGFAPNNPGWDNDAPGNPNVADRLADIGASPQHFNYRSGSYAFFGGIQLGSKGAAQSNSSLVADPVKQGRQSGKLSGEATMSPNGYFIPPTGAATASPIQSLYDLVFNTTPQAFPFTTGPEANAYGKALQYISGELGTPAVYDFYLDFNPTSGAKYTGNIRAAYLGLPSYNRWDDARMALDANVKYPDGSNPQCNPSAAPAPAPPAPGFTSNQFACLKAQLVKEFVALVDSKDYVDSLESSVSLAASDDKGALAETYSVLRDATDQPDGTLTTEIVFLVGALAELADLAEIALAPEVAVAAELAAEIMDLTSAVSSANNKPIGDVLSDTVENLGGDLNASVGKAASSLDSIRATSMSDWGRLQALAAQDQSVETQTRTAVADRFANAGGRFLSTQLIQSLESGGRYTSFRIYTDGTGKNGGPNPYPDCHYRYRDWTQHSWTPFLYHLDQWSSLVYAWAGNDYSDYPPESLMQQLFASPSQDATDTKLGQGYGIYAPTWFWQQALPAVTYLDQFDPCETGG